MRDWWVTVRVVCATSVALTREPHQATRGGGIPWVPCGAFVFVPVGVPQPT